jgi:hypothetical protein
MTFTKSFTGAAQIVRGGQIRPNRLKGKGIEDRAMPKPAEYRYVIDVFTPDTLPMARLAEYMRELAMLLGEPANVHFDRLERGSAVLVSKIDPPAVPKVVSRVEGLRDGSAGEDVRKAFQTLDKMLRQDNAIGTLLNEVGAEIIAFPGRTRPKPPVFGPFYQDGTLDGVLTRIGGRSDKTVYALLDDGTRVLRCTLGRDLARQLAQHLFSPVRVMGRGRWTRDEEGDWRLERFRVVSFDVLNDESLLAVVAKLREVPGNGWKTVRNPLKELEDLRGNDD